MTPKLEGETYIKYISLKTLEAAHCSNNAATPSTPKVTFGCISSIIWLAPSKASALARQHPPLPPGAEATTPRHERQRGDHCHGPRLH